MKTMNDTVAINLPPRLLKQGAPVTVIDVDGALMGSGKLEVVDGRARVTCAIERDGTPVAYQIGDLRLPLHDYNGRYLSPMGPTFSVRIDFGSPPGIDPARHVVIDYTNHRGERALRTVEPMAMEYRVSPWHEGKQWIMQAWDVDKEAERDFAMKDIHSWRAK
jgi:hypothetical protein